MVTQGSFGVIFNLLVSVGMLEAIPSCRSHRFDDIHVTSSCLPWLTGLVSASGLPLLVKYKN